MKADNPFDKKLQLNNNIPDMFREALVNVTNTLDFSWAAALTVFEDKATPEHALQICKMVLDEHLRIIQQRHRDIAE